MVSSRLTCETTLRIYENRLIFEIKPPINDCSTKTKRFWQNSNGNTLTISIIIWTIKTPRINPNNKPKPLSTKPINAISWSCVTHWQIIKKIILILKSLTTFMKKIIFKHLPTTVDTNFSMKQLLNTMLQLLSPHTTM